jgi:hypothetical protein
MRPIRGARAALFHRRATALRRARLRGARRAPTVARKANILLAGANGNVSSAIIRALQGSGHHLICVVRDRAKAAPLAELGVERCTGDLDDLRTLEHGVFAAPTSRGSSPRRGRGRRCSRRTRGGSRARPASAASPASSSSRSPTPARPPR